METVTNELRLYMAAAQGTTFKKENNHHNLSDILWLLDMSQFEGDIFCQESETNKFLTTDGFKKKKVKSIFIWLITKNLRSLF